jgi:hypothetical protein
MVKIQGTPSMRSHISVHRATTKYFSNSFVFKTKIEKEGLPGDRTPALRAGAREHDPVLDQGEIIITTTVTPTDQINDLQWYLGKQ